MWKVCMCVCEVWMCARMCECVCEWERQRDQNGDK